NIISSRARSLLGERIFDYEKALGDISQEKSRYLALQKEASDQVLVLKNEREAFKAQKQLLLKMQQEELFKKYDHFIDKVKREVENLRRGEGSTNKVFNSMSQGRRELSLPSSSNAPTQQLHNLPDVATGL